MVRSRAGLILLGLQSTETMFWVIFALMKWLRWLCKPECLPVSQGRGQLQRRRLGGAYGQAGFLRVWRFVAVLACGFLFCGAGLAAPDDEDVRLGVLANRGVEHAMARWSATADYLTDRIPGQRFRIVPLEFEAVAPAVAAGAVDYVLANPLVHVSLEHDYHVSAVATMINRLGDSSYAVFGGVIFRRTDGQGPFGLEMLRGGRFVAADSTSFGGYLMALREIRRQGVGPEDFASLSFAGTHDGVVRAVLAGEADAGTVRSDVLERMVADGVLDLDQIQLFTVPEAGGANVSFLHNTRLYPEWPLARLKHVPYSDAEKVAAALLAMEADEPAARIASVAGWTLPLSYVAVHELLRELNMPPYDARADFGWWDVIQRYRLEAVLALLLVMASWGLIAWVMRTNKRLRAAQDEMGQVNQRLAHEMKAQEVLNRHLLDTRSRLVESEKMASIGVLAAGLAHEINTPLAYVGSNFGVLQRYNHELSTVAEQFAKLVSDLPDDSPCRQSLTAVLDRCDLAFLREDTDLLINETRQGLERVSVIVRGLLTLSQTDSGRVQTADLNICIQDALGLVRHLLAGCAEIRLDLGDLPAVECQPEAIEQVLVNLMTNAAQAMTQGGVLSLSSRQQGNEVCVEIADSGPGINPACLDKIFDPFFTTKAVGAGTGLGLSIAYGIVRRHGGRIEVLSEPGKGACFRVVLPLTQPDLSLS